MRRRLRLAGWPSSWAAVVMVSLSLGMSSTAEDDVAARVADGLEVQGCLFTSCLRDCERSWQDEMFPRRASAQPEQLSMQRGSRR